MQLDSHVCRRSLPPWNAAHAGHMAASFLAASSAELEGVMAKHPLHEAIQCCMRGGRPAKSYGGGRGRGRGRNSIKPGQRPVSEAARIDITEQLETFQQSDESGMLRSVLN